MERSRILMSFPQALLSKAGIMGGSTCHGQRAKNNRSLQLLTECDAFANMGLNEPVVFFFFFFSQLSRGGHGVLRRSENSAEEANVAC